MAAPRRTSGALAEPHFAPDEPDVMVTEMRRNASQPEDRHVAKRPRDLPFLMDGDHLRVINDMDKPVAFTWGRKPHVIYPDSEGFVPFEALVNQLGDPRSRPMAVTKYDDGQGSRGQIMDRHAELTRLFAMYAVQNEQINTVIDSKGRPVPGLTEKAPKVRVYTLAGVQIQFPALLPEMTPYPVINNGQRQVNSDNTAAISKLEAENAAMHETVERLEARMDSDVRSREGLDAEV